MQAVIGYMHDVTTMYIRIIILNYVFTGLKTLLLPKPPDTITLSGKLSKLLV